MKWSGFADESNKRTKVEKENIKKTKKQSQKKKQTCEVLMPSEVIHFFLSALKRHAFSLTTNLLLPPSILLLFKWAAGRSGCSGGVELSQSWFNLRNLLPKKTTRPLTYVTEKRLKSKVIHNSTISQKKKTQNCRTPIPELQPNNAWKQPTTFYFFLTSSRSHFTTAAAAEEVWAIALCSVAFATTRLWPLSKEKKNGRTIRASEQDQTKGSHKHVIS